MVVNLHRNNFNPRSRTGSDPCLPTFLDCTNISIHAPARGATICRIPHQLSVKIISIHAPARGATWMLRKNRYCRCIFQSTLPHGERRYHIIWILICCEFQSTLPHGERRKGYLDNLIFSRISIHAPARGATFPYFLQFQIVEISIHAPARGATEIPAQPLFLFKFQSTLPHGERRRPVLNFGTRFHFNPRSRTGSDFSIFPPISNS